MYLYLVFLMLIVTVIVSARVKTVFAKYDQQPLASGLTANAAAERILRSYGLSVPILSVSGKLTDHYDVRNVSLSLSESTFGKCSAGAVGVAAHEACHALQHAENYAFLNLRSALVPAVNYGSYGGILLAVLGGFISGSAGDNLINLGIILYSATFVFALVTLPVEFNASRRATAELTAMNCLTAEEMKGVKKVLRAAALTYVAAMAAALVNLLRFISIFSGRRRR